jgi:hypothetical protein
MTICLIVNIVYGIISNTMQYFMALKIGERRVKSARELLSKYTGNAMPALALKDDRSDKWEPVGEENMVAVVNETNGFMIVLCDKNGVAKSIAQWFTEDIKNEILERITREQRIERYAGKLSLPI